jgi:hypothetical protein
MMVSVKRSGSRRTSGWLLVLLSAAGAVSGQLVNAARACACSCVEDNWDLVLSSATSSDPSVDHRAYWPASANLTSYSGHAHIWAISTAETGMVERAGAGK